MCIAFDTLQKNIKVAIRCTYKLQKLDIYRQETEKEKRQI